MPAGITVPTLRRLGVQDAAPLSLQTVQIRRRRKTKHRNADYQVALHTLGEACQLVNTRWLGSGDSVAEAVALAGRQAPGVAIRFGFKHASRRLKKGT